MVKLQYFQDSQQLKIIKVGIMQDNKSKSDDDAGPWRRCNGTDWLSYILDVGDGVREKKLESRQKKRLHLHTISNKRKIFGYCREIDSDQGR